MLDFSHLKNMNYSFIFLAISLFVHVTLNKGLCYHQTTDVNKILNITTSLLYIYIYSSLVIRVVCWQFDMVATMMRICYLIMGLVPVISQEPSHDGLMVPPFGGGDPGESTVFSKYAIILTGC